MIPVPMMRVQTPFYRCYGTWLLWLILLGLPLVGLHASQQANSPSAPEHTAFRLLDYLKRDYHRCVDPQGHMTDPMEHAEQVEFAQAFEAWVQALPADAIPAALLQQWQQHAARLVAAIQNPSPPAEVEAIITALEHALLAHYPDPRGIPARVTLLPPEQTHALYQTHCASCHGITGNGQGPLYAAIPPPSPVNFLDPTRTQGASLWSYQQSIAHGIPGSAMRAFTELSEDAQWSLAAFVWGLSAPTGSDANPWDRTCQLIQASVHAYEQGDTQTAKQTAIAAYLEGFEPLEMVLDTHHLESTRHRIEQDFMAFRKAVGTPDQRDSVIQLSTHMIQALRDAQAAVLQDNPTNRAWEQGLAASIILLREGLEGMLVLATVFSVVHKMGAHALKPAIHMGWISALGMGGLTWLAAQSLITISGASREVTEGVTAWLAAATLLWVGIWLHQHATAQKWQTFIRTQLQKTIAGHHRTAAWGLGLLVFVSIYREVFETILFYQTLWHSHGAHHPAILWGMATGLGGLIIVAGCLYGLSARLPIGLFFRISTQIMGGLAVVFLGEGTAALQEAGWLSYTPIPLLPPLPWIAFYPTAEGLGIQLMGLGIMAWGLRTRPATPPATKP